jgi:hypothetical protein
MKITTSILAVALVTTVAIGAHADPVAPPADKEKPSTAAAVKSASTPTKEDKTIHAHDGFYLRLGLGLGGFTDNMSAHDEAANGETDTGTITGIASASEVMIGGTLSPHWIIGGGIWTSTTFVSDYVNTNNDGIPTDLRKPDNFTLVGPFLDWYFSERLDLEPPGGFHAQAGLGFAVLNGFKLEQVRHDDRRVAIGAGIMLGAGYEWWVSEQWGLGVLARLTAAGMIEEDDRDDMWSHGTATFPAFLFTGTYN